MVGDRSITYAELADAVASCAAGLAAHGVGRGDRVAVVEAGGLLSAAVILGAAHVGAAAALMNVQLKAAELQELVQTSSCAKVGVAGAPYRDALGTAVGTVLGADELLGNDPSAAPAVVEPDDDLDALVLFTSGTTGLPKAIPITAGPLARRLSTMGAPFDPASAPVVGFMCVPVFHVGGSLGLVSALRGGRTTVVQPRFDAGEWLRLVERYRVSSVFVVPTMLQRILDHPDFATTDLSSLVGVFYGAAAAPVELVAARDGGTARRRVRQRVRPDRDAGRLHHAHRRRPPRARAHRLGRPRACRASTCGSSTPRPATTCPTARSASCGCAPTRTCATAGCTPAISPVATPTATSTRRAVSPTRSTVAARSSGRSRSRPCCASTLRCATWRPRACPTRRWGSGSAWRWWSRDGELTADEVKAFCSARLAIYKTPEIVVFVDDLPYNDTGKVVRRALVEVIQRDSTSSGVKNPS